ncbi:hypothetical protein ACS0TY_017207 [Phlomoides rotata]
MSRGVLHLHCTCILTILHIPKMINIPLKNGAIYILITIFIILSLNSFSQKQELPISYPFEGVK